MKTADEDKMFLLEDQRDDSLQAECGGAMTLLFRFAPATFGSLSAVELWFY